MLHSPIKPCLTQGEFDLIDQVIGRVAFDREGHVIRINQRMLDLFGYQGWDLIGRSKSIFSAADGKASVADIVDRAMTDGTRFAGDLCLQRRDGMTFWGETVCRAVLDDEGGVREVVLFMRDATERMTAAADDAGQLVAINASHAVIQFAPDGTVLRANPLFLEIMGYELADVVGQHHRLFVDPVDAASEGYARFWASLRDGVYAAGEYRRLTKAGKPVWLRATYNPIFDHDGRAVKIVKYATDVSAEKQQAADFKGQIAAIGLSQCVATYALDGTILGANARFLEEIGYSIDELEGRHHRIFVDPAFAHSLDYEIFWTDLAAGRYRRGEFRRLGKAGREIWFQSIYSPVLDQDGRPFKVVNYATAITKEKLRQADHQGQIAALHKSQGVVSFTPDGIIMDANDNFLELTGYRLSQVIGRHHSMFLSPDDRADTYDGFWRDLAGGDYKGGEFKLLCNGGAETWIQASYNPILDMNGRPFKVVMNAVDVTEQRLRQSDYEGQIAAINKSHCVVTFGLDGIVMDANENFLRLMKYDLEEVRGLHHRVFVDAASVADADYEALWTGLREGRFHSSKFRRVAKDGSEVWIQASYNPIHDLNGRPFKVVEIAADITADIGLAADLIRAQREVEHDAATGLPNRLGLRRFLADALSATDSELALLYLDLDHFKPINDTFGHDVGDYVLKTVANRLREEVADDQMVARIGGDEFVVAVPSLPRAAVATLAERLIEAVSQPIPHRGRILEVGLSIGVALTPGDTLDEDELFRCADVALYRSKGSQRGTVSFYGEHSEASAEAERHLAHEMRIAIKAKRLGLIATPWHRGSDGAVDTVSVRASWDHPQLGILHQDRFLKIAEQSGLIVPLGDWVVREACRYAKALDGVRVAVSAFPRQLLSSDVPGMIALALRETGLPAERLVVHIERGTSRVNPTAMQAGIARLSAMGVMVTGDSFMVGDDLSSVWLRHPLTRVLLDRRLKNALPDSAQSTDWAEEALGEQETSASEDSKPAQHWIDKDHVIASFTPGTDAIII